MSKIKKIVLSLILLAILFPLRLYFPRFTLSATILGTILKGGV